MKVAIGDTAYLVKWVHDREDKVTICFVHAPNGSAKTHICSGIAVFGNGNFCYNKARKLSLGKALHRLIPDRKVNDGLGHRIAFWNEYFKMRGNKW